MAKLVSFENTFLEDENDQRLKDLIYNEWHRCT